MSRLLPLDPRRSTAMEGHRNHKGHAGDGQKDGQLQASDRKWKGLRGDISEVISEQRHFYVVGDPTVVTEVPRPEINVKPWERLLRELKEGNKRRNWMEREAYAYWKGNPVWIFLNVTFPTRRTAMLAYIPRYKIYIEGSAWSVSEKNILACDSVTLIVKPHYYDFFTTSLIPVHHYWPIKEDNKCKSIKFAVDWGNSHKKKAHDIGKEASNFIHEDLKMDYVYDYMFHLLNEYAKLLRFKPTVPEKAIELCSETMACPAQGFEKKFMMESLVKGPTDVGPCTMPPPYEPLALRSLLKRKTNSIKQVEMWEKRYWEDQNKQI